MFSRLFPTPSSASSNAPYAEVATKILIPGIQSDLDPDIVFPHRHKTLLTFNMDHSIESLHHPHDSRPFNHFRI
jgi:hypothetical protein